MHYVSLETFQKEACAKIIGSNVNHDSTTIMLEDDAQNELIIASDEDNKKGPVPDCNQDDMIHLFSISRVRNESLQ